MPYMPRPSKKAAKIAYRLIGIPDSMRQHEKKNFRDLQKPMKEPKQGEPYDFPVR